MTGIEYQYLRIRRHKLFKEAEFDLSYRGVSVLLGLNRDANAGSTNAAGKSSFFSEIPELTISASSLVDKVEKIGPKGSVYLRVKNQGDLWEALRKQRGGRDAILLRKNGKDLKVRTKDWAKQRLAAVIDRTPEEFFSLDYIDSRRPHPLHMGSTAQRRDFVISMFRLENVDNLRKLFSSELRRIAEDRSAYEEVKRQYNSLSEQLVDESEEQLQASVERMEKQYKVLSDRVHKAATINDLFNFRRESKKNIDILLKLTNDDLSSFETVLKDYEKKLRQLNLTLKTAIRWTRYKERLKEYKEAKEDIERKVGEITQEEAKEGAEKYREVEKEIHHLQQEIKKLRENLPEKEELDENSERLVQKYSAEPIRLERLVNSNRTDVLNTTELLSIAEKKHLGDRCPLCGSDVEKKLDAGSIRSRLNTLRKNGSRLERLWETLNRRVDRRKCLKKIRDIEGHLVRCEIRKKKLRASFDAAQAYEKLPIKPDRPTSSDDAEEGLRGTYDEGEIREKIEKYSKRVEFLKMMQPVLERVEKCLSLTENDKQEMQHLDDLRKRLDKIVNILPSRKSTLDKMKIVKKEMANLRERGRELKDSVEDEEAYKLLVEAYGNAGIKKLMLQRIGSHLETCFNRYARFVFSESYQFKVNIDTQFDILVKRQYAHRTLVSDVRKLSGAESRAFALLLYLSLLSLVPASRRSNILILDEPDANLGQEMRDNFVKFLPYLNKIVPHIIIITPHNYQYPNARVFTVVKKNGWSRIVKGAIKNGISKVGN
jgi:DNA repair exonuclease SbcCD ATPase subunit